MTSDLHIVSMPSVPVDVYRQSRCMLLRIGPVDIYARPDQLEEIRGRIDAALHEIREPAGVPIPADAACEIGLPEEVVAS